MSHLAQKCLTRRRCKTGESMNEDSFFQASWLFTLAVYCKLGPEEALRLGGWMSSLGCSNGWIVLNGQRLGVEHQVMAGWLG